MKLKEVLESVDLSEITLGIELYEGEYVDGRLHTQSLSFAGEHIYSVEDWEDPILIEQIAQLDEKILNREVATYEVMTPHYYDCSVISNTCVSTKDFGWEDNDKILCVLLERSE